MIQFMTEYFRVRRKLTATLALGTLRRKEQGSINNFPPVEVSSEFKLMFKLSSSKLPAALVPFNVTQVNGLILYFLPNTHSVCHWITLCSKCISNLHSRITRNNIDALFSGTMMWF